MKSGMSRHSKKLETLVWVLILSHLSWCQTILAQGGSSGSVALVSNVTGKATIYHDEVPVDVSFKAPVVFGDRIQTGSQSMIAMLVGDDALVALKEFSEMRVIEEPGFPQVINLAKGQVCISTKRDGEPVKVEVPGTTIAVEPGSMASIQVSLSDPKNRSAQRPDYLHKTTIGQNNKQSSPVAKAQELETVKILVSVKEGSVSLVSQIVGKAPVTVGAEQGVQVVGGTISPPFASKEVYCQIQDLQQDPQHTATPEETKDQIGEDQQNQVNQLVALLGVGASAPEPVVPPNIPNDPDIVIPTTKLNEAGFPQDPFLPPDSPPLNPGDPLIQVENSSLNVDSPFFIASSGETTVNGPPLQLTLNNHSGSITQIDPNQVLQGLSPERISELLEAFPDPNNPDRLMAGLRVQSSSQGGAARVFGGLRVVNSQVQAPVEFVQIGSPGNTEFTEVTLSGPLLDLNNSSFEGINTLIALRNGELDAQSSNQPLVVVAGESSNLSLNDEASFLTANPSTVKSPSGVLSLSNGATSTIAGSVIELNGSTLDSSGGQQALVTIENGSQITVQGNLVSANNGSTITAPGGMLSLNGGQANIRNDFVSLNASHAETSHGVVMAVNNSQVNIGGYLLALSNGASLTTNGMPVAILAGSTLQADGLLRVSQPGTVASAGDNPLVRVEGQSSLTILENFLDIIESQSGSVITINAAKGFVNVQDSNGETMEDPGLTVLGDFLRIDGFGGVEVGTDEALISANNGRINIQKNGVVLSNFFGAILDSKLAEATRPLIHLVNNSRMEVAGNLANLESSSLAFGKDFEGVTNDAIVMVDASRFAVNGNLFALNGSSSLDVQGVLASIANGSIFEVNGALVGFTNGGNVFSIANNLCSSGGGACQTFGANVRVFFPTGTTAENNNFIISQNYNAFTGITSDKVSFNPESDALLTVEGTGNTIALGNTSSPIPR